MYYHIQTRHFASLAPLVSLRPNVFGIRDDRDRALRVFAGWVDEFEEDIPMSPVASGWL